MRNLFILSILPFWGCTGDGIKGSYSVSLDDDSAIEVNPDPEDCTDQTDNDLDGAIDCLDEDCVTELSCIDDDGDGFSAAEDCDDADSNTYPGAAENESPVNCMTDKDGDGFGDSEPSASGAIAGNDCDDTNPAFFPGAEEIPDDGIDQDCDGEDATANVDSDNDGHGVFTDCDDNDASAYPGAAEMESETMCMRDYDQDGYGDNAPSNPTVEAGTDCDDNYFSINPGALDSLGDGIDSNCDGVDGNNQGGGGQGSATECCYDLIMIDAMGDGWNTGTVDHYENGFFIQSSTLFTGFMEIDTICLQNGSFYELFYYSGFADQDVSFELMDGPNLLAYIMSPTTGLQYANMVSCP